MKNKKFRLNLLWMAVFILLLSACSAEPHENKILITHSDQPKPTTFPADVEYNYIIKDGYKLPDEQMMVTFKWHQNGSYSRTYWMYQVKQKDDGYSILDTDYEGFYVDDITKFGFSPVSVLSDRKGTFTLSVDSESKYENPIGESGVHLFEELLVKEGTTESSHSSQ